MLYSDALFYIWSVDGDGELVCAVGAAMVCDLTHSHRQIYASCVFSDHYLWKMCTEWYDKF